MKDILLFLTEVLLFLCVLQENELLSLVRSLLMAWSDPLALLSSESISLPHPGRNSINSKTRELQDHSSSLGAGLEHLFHKVPELLLRKLSVFKLPRTLGLNIYIKVKAVCSG